MKLQFIHISAKHYYHQSDVEHNIHYKLEGKNYIKILIMYVIVIVKHEFLQIL